MGILIGINKLHLAAGAPKRRPDGAPYDLVLAPIAATALSVTFSSTATNQDGYRIYISTDGVNYTENKTVSSSPTTVGGLTTLTRYYVKVVAYKGTYESTAAEGNVYVFDPIPAYSSALFVLAYVDGNYMVDAINGWQFPINNKDWTADEGHWTGDVTVLPFKTAATLSPPSDAAIKTQIQAYDVNNFWYAGDGTPNTIPIQALYQNIDFANKCFCKQVAHTLNADLEETVPAGVKYITLYKSEQTVDASFTTYFGSEATRPTSNVLFVSKAGNDTTGNGSYATPYLTIDKGLQTLTTGHILWVLSGAYNEASAGYDYLRITRNSTTLTVKGCGNVQLLSANASYIFYNGSYTSYISCYGIIFNGYKSIYFNTRPIIFSRCYFKGSGFGNAGCTTGIERSVINNGDNSFTTYFGADAAYFKENFVYNVNCSLSAQAAAKIVVTYNRGIRDNATNDRVFGYGTAIGGMTFKYNYVKAINSGTSTGCLDIYSTRVKDFTHVCILERNIFIGGATVVNFRITDITATSNVDFTYRYNVLIMQGSSYGLKFAPVTSNIMHTALIEKNYFYGDNGLITIVPTAINCPVQINYNRFFATDKTNAAVTFGEGTDGLCDGSEIIGNLFYGYQHAAAYDDAAGQHGLLVQGGINFTIKYNMFKGCGLGMAWKCRDGDTYTDGGMMYNVFFNNNAHFYTRRLQAGRYYNNTMACSLANSRIGAIDAQGYACEDQLFKNNIFKHTGRSLLFALADSILQGAAGDVLFDDNIFDDNSGKPIIHYITALTELTYAQAVAAGFITNGEQAVPVFNNLAAGELWLQSGSAGRGDGTDLGAALDDGLDISTDWNDDVNDTDPDHYPTIVTKQQGVSWDKGAYVH